MGIREAERGKWESPAPFLAVEPGDAHRRDGVAFREAHGALSAAGPGLLLEIGKRDAFALTRRGEEHQTRACGDVGGSFVVYRVVVYLRRLRRLRIVLLGHVFFARPFVQLQLFHKPRRNNRHPRDVRGKRVLGVFLVLPQGFQRVLLRGLELHRLDAARGSALRADGIGVEMNKRTVDAADQNPIPFAHHLHVLQPVTRS